MAVKSTDLRNPEQDFDINTREGKSAKPSADEELQNLRGRIAAVKGTEPKDEATHCADCFARGWRAAVRAIEAKP